MFLNSARRLSRFNLFMNQQQQQQKRFLNVETSPVNPKNWKYHESLMYYESPNVIFSPKIAAFGFNKCLVTTSLFQRAADAWKLRYSNVPDRLKQLHAEGYKLVIFTNQSPIGIAQDPEAKERILAQFTAKVAGLLEVVDLPFQVFVSTSRTPRKTETPFIDTFRKPQPGMWEYLINHCNDSIPPDLSTCFYVGGAAGRPKMGIKRPDHSNYDIEFAKNCGLKFYPDDEYFGLDLKQKGPSQPRKVVPKAEGEHEQEVKIAKKVRGRGKKEAKETETEAVAEAQE